MRADLPVDTQMATDPIKTGSEDDASAKRRRMRSIAIAMALFVLVALFYAATIVHLGPNVMNRPL